MNNELYQQVGIPPQGAQVVPVYQGLKPKKPVIDNGKFLFQFFFLNEGFETPCVRMKLLGSLSKNLPRKSVMPKGQTTLLQKQNDWKFRLLQNEAESRLPVVARSSKCLCLQAPLWSIGTSYQLSCTASVYITGRRFFPVQFMLN